MTYMTYMTFDLGIWYAGLPWHCPGRIRWSRL